MRNWDHEIQLIHVIKGEDDEGFPVNTSKETVVLANKLPVPSSEFYQSSREGYIISQLFEINSIEYSGETSLNCDGDFYRIRRSYDKGEYIELSCERRDDSFE